MKTKDFLDVKLAELKAKLDKLKGKAGAEFQEEVDEIEAKIEEVLKDFDAVLDEEIAEFKEVGLFAWIKLNPGKFAGLLGLFAAAANGVLAVFGLNFGL